MLVRVQADIKGKVSEDRSKQKAGQGTGRRKGTGFRRQVSTEGWSGYRQT